MKTILTLILTAAAVQQTVPEKPKVDAPKTDSIEKPVLDAIVSPVERYDLAKTNIPWQRGLSAALHKGKPVLLFQLLGNFDEVYC